MSTDLTKVVDSINKKLALLNENQDRLRSENEQLLNQLTALEIRNTELQRVLDEKEESIKRLKLARTVAGDKTDTQGVKRQINELVKEIDKCVALLNR